MKIKLNIAKNELGKAGDVLDVTDKVGSALVCAGVADVIDHSRHKDDPERGAPGVVSGTKVEPAPQRVIIAGVDVSGDDGAEGNN